MTIIHSGICLAIGIFVGYNMGISAGNTFKERVKSYFNYQRIDRDA